jgi:hypothetical protein
MIKLKIKYNSNYDGVFYSWYMIYLLHCAVLTLSNVMWSLGTRKLLQIDENVWKLRKCAVWAVEFNVVLRVPLISIYTSDYVERRIELQENVDLYFHFPICLHCVVLNLVKHRDSFTFLPLIYTTLNVNVNSLHSPCGGGVEYLHRDPASRKRRRNGTKKGRAIA